MKKYDDYDMIYECWLNAEVVSSTPDITEVVLMLKSAPHVIRHVTSSSANLIPRFRIILDALFGVHS